MWKSLIALMTLTISGFAAGQPGMMEPATSQQEPLQSHTQNMMMINPAFRALDLQQAFEMLRKEKTTGKVYFQLTDGSTISNIIDMTLMSNSTLILFRFNSTQGIRFQVVKVEDIVGLTY